MNFPFTTCSFTSFNPDLLNSDVIIPSGAQRKGPGLPGTGGFSCSIRIITSMELEIHGFFSGAFHTAAAIVPPGFSTRIISANDCSMSGKNIKLKRQVTASNELSSKGKDELSKQNVS